MFGFFRKKPKEPEFDIKSGDLVYIADHCCEHVAFMRNYFFVVGTIWLVNGGCLTCGQCGWLVQAKAYTCPPGKPWNIPLHWLRKVPPEKLTVEEKHEALSELVRDMPHENCRCAPLTEKNDEPCPF